MPTIDQYTNTDAFIRLLLQGPPGVGKTTLACQFPGAWVMDCDVNLRGPLQFLHEQKAKGKDVSLPIGYDIIDRTEDGKPVPEGSRYQRLLDCANKAAAQPGVKTVVFDSATKISDYIKAHVLRTQPTKTGQMEITSWGFFYNTWVSLVATVTAAKLHSVFIFHEKVEKDEVDGSLKYLINVQGQFQGIAGALFTDVWRAEVAGGGGINPTKESYRWLIRTMPDYRFVLKNSFGLPPTFEFDWKLIEDKLNGGKTK